MANKKTYFKLGIIILSILLIVVFVNGFLDGYQDSIEKSDQITEILEEHCECDEVNRILYAKGLQFGNDGISTEKAEYELINCNYESFKEEASRINKILNKEVRGFDVIDQITLEFNNNQHNETVIIKNGIIQ